MIGPRCALPAAAGSRLRAVARGHERPHPQRRAVPVRPDLRSGCCTSDSDAFTLLAQASMHSNRKVRDVADALVHTGELPRE